MEYKETKPSVSTWGEWDFDFLSKEDFEKAVKLLKHNKINFGTGSSFRISSDNKQVVDKIRELLKTSTSRG